MLRFDHLRIPVTDLDRSRRWYVDTLGLAVEFEVPDRQTVALQDGHDFTIFLRLTDVLYRDLSLRTLSRNFGAHCE